LDALSQCSQLPAMLSAKKDRNLHQIVNLNLPHAQERKLYLENGGRRVLHVFPDLLYSETQKLEALRDSLNKLLGGLHGYDECIVHTKDKSDAPETLKACAAQKSSLLDKRLIYAFVRSNA
ncbi:MAG TPA: hypothetical protein VME69_16950, partial [Methylocella sp.]|nr:hypothetical protein [Methylocella sp.]